LLRIFCGQKGCTRLFSKIYLDWYWSSFIIFLRVQIPLPYGRMGNTSVLYTCTSIPGGHAVAQCLRHCATNRKFAGSICDGITGIFHWHNPSGRTMTLGSTQPLTEMSTRNILGGKGGRCVGLTTLPPSFADWLKIWDSRRLRLPDFKTSAHEGGRNGISYIVFK
jgi:hypothetical protein